MWGGRLGPGRRRGCGAGLRRGRVPRLRGSDALGPVRAGAGGGAPLGARVAAVPSVRRVRAGPRKPAPRTRPGPARARPPPRPPPALAGRGIVRFPARGPCRDGRSPGRGKAASKRRADGMAPPGSGSPPVGRFRCWTPLPGRASVLSGRALRTVGRPARETGGALAIPLRTGQEGAGPSRRFTEKRSGLALEAGPAFGTPDRPGAARVGQGMIRPLAPFRPSPLFPPA